ncbi:Transposable element Tc3 transposase, partial [Fusarium oxysporum f. sp. albedinis]
QAVAGAVFNTAAQLGNTMGLAAMQIISTWVTKQQEKVKSPTQALMEGYRATFWTMLALLLICTIVGASGLRKAGKETALKKVINTTWSIHWRNNRRLFLSSLPSSLGNLIMDASIFLAILGVAIPSFSLHVSFSESSKFATYNFVKGVGKIANARTNVKAIGCLTRLAHRQGIADDIVNDLDYLLNFVGRMTDYSEPDLVYLLERLVSLNYKSLPKSRRKAPVTNESWGTAACQKRRLQKLKGQKPYYKASRALYKCSICANVFHTWSAAAQHCKETHFGPVAVYCMSCGYRLPVSRRNQHESFCGWRILDGDPNKPSRIWLCCLQNLLRLTKREVCELIAMCDFLRPDGRCNTRGKHCPGDTVTLI